MIESSEQKEQECSLLNTRSKTDLLPYLLLSDLPIPVCCRGACSSENAFLKRLYTTAL